MFQKLIVPVDGSAASFAAVPVAARMAAAVAGSFEVVTIVDRLADVALARDALDRHLAELTGVPEEIERHVLAGETVAQVIARRVEETPGSMVVMSSHGHGRSAAVLGSTCDGVLREMFGPVIVIGPNVDDFRWTPRRHLRRSARRLEARGRRSAHRGCLDCRVPGHTMGDRGGQGMAHVRRGCRRLVVRQRPRARAAPPDRPRRRVRRRVRRPARRSCRPRDQRLRRGDERLARVPDNARANWPRSPADRFGSCQGDSTRPLPRRPVPSTGAPRRGRTSVIRRRRQQAARIGCAAGALSCDAYQQQLVTAGFTNITVTLARIRRRSPRGDHPRHQTVTPDVTFRAMQSDGWYSARRPRRIRRRSRSGRSLHVDAASATTA